MRFSRNRRAISTVIATVFFLGIAISVALALFMMSSTYNNLYQQQLNVREDRLDEKIQVVEWDTVQENKSAPTPQTVQNFTLGVMNTGTVSAHIVSVYVNNVLVWNKDDSDVWTAPLEEGWTPLIIHPLTWGSNGDNVTVSTDRGNRAVWQVTRPPKSYVPPPGGGSGKTPYAINIQETNPQYPSKNHNPHQATVFRYSFWVIDEQSLPPGFPEDNLVPPGFDVNNVEGWNYSTPTSPEGFVGVYVGRTYVIWAVETQYSSNGDLIWARVGPGRIEDRPLTAEIPAEAPTFIWVVQVSLADYSISSIPPFGVTVTIIPSSPPDVKVTSGTLAPTIYVRVMAEGPVSTSIWQNLINTKATLTVVGTPSATYTIQSTSQGPALNTIDIQSGLTTGLVENGVMTEGWWQIVVNGVMNDSITFKVTVTGVGSYDGKTYTATTNSVTMKVK